jgi:hypothetical protein
VGNLLVPSGEILPETLTDRLRAYVGLNIDLLRSCCSEKRSF